MSGFTKDSFSAGRTMARKGRSSPTLVGVGGLGCSFEFGSMRNTSKQRERVGRPVYFHERPADRPFANELGERLVRETRMQGFGRYDMKAKESDGVKLKPFSWERADV